MTTILTPEQQAQILTPSVRRLLSALQQDGEARVVGGAVRDVLQGRKVGDIDLASTLPPHRAIEILAQNGIKTVPTGLLHGTITAVIDHVGYEITTLRRDVETDGRHAQVAFTNDWHEDAARRDFTFNALYVDSEGRLYDYFNGEADAKQGRVRFIGDARTRIREDVLRILRFFRFFAWFGQGEPDAEALGACRELVELIPHLSIERVTREVLKLLAADNPVPAWKLMLQAGATAHFLPTALDIAHLELMLANEKSQGEPPVALARLAALLPQGETVAEAVAAQLKLSNRDSDKLFALVKLPALLREGFSALALRRAFYVFGIDNCRSALLLAAPDAAIVRTAFITVAAWQNPVFPLRGEDMIKLGIPAGPRIGQILQAVEEWWIAGDFLADREACLAQAKIYGKVP